MAFDLLNTTASVRRAEQTSRSLIYSSPLQHFYLVSHLKTLPPQYQTVSLQRAIFWHFLPLILTTVSLCGVDDTWDKVYVTCNDDRASYFKWWIHGSEFVILRVIHLVREQDVICCKSWSIEQLDTCSQMFRRFQMKLRNPSLFVSSTF